MKLRAKREKILKEPKIKKKMDERGTGLLDGPQCLKDCPLSDLCGCCCLGSALSSLGVRLSKAKGIWRIPDLWVMRGCKPLPMAGRETDVCFLCSHSSRTLETVFLTSFSPRTWIIILHIKYLPCVIIKSLWGCVAGKKKKGRKGNKHTEHITYGKQHWLLRNENSWHQKKLWGFLTQSSLLRSSWFRSLGLRQSHFLPNPCVVTQQLHCWIVWVLFKSTLPALIHSILKTSLWGRHWFLHFTD